MSLSSARAASAFAQSGLPSAGKSAASYRSEKISLRAGLVREHGAELVVYSSSATLALKRNCPSSPPPPSRSAHGSGPREGRGPRSAPPHGSPTPSREQASPVAGGAAREGPCRRLEGGSGGPAHAPSLPCCSRCEPRPSNIPKFRTIKLDGAGGGLGRARRVPRDQLALHAAGLGPSACGGSRCRPGRAPRCWCRRRSSARACRAGRRAAPRRAPARAARRACRGCAASGPPSRCRRAGVAALEGEDPRVLEEAPDDRDDADVLRHPGTPAAGSRSRGC